MTTETRVAAAEQERDEYKQAYEVTLAQRDSAGRDYQAMRQERDHLRASIDDILDWMWRFVAGSEPVFMKLLREKLIAATIETQETASDGEPA